jgi:hypothetical protein
MAVNYNTKIIELKNTIKEAVKAVGGMGCDLALDDYVADVVKNWSNSREQIASALECFRWVRDTRWHTGCAA